MKHTRESVLHYFDYKSPYAFLAQSANDGLEARFGVTVTRVPYSLRIADYLGEAALDAEGRDTIGTRNAHQWRRVRYSYMDCRREANRRGLIIRGPRKIWNTDLAHMGFLYATSHPGWRTYHAQVFTRFWRRELDIEDPGAIAGLLAECEVPAAAFTAFAAGEGRVLLARLRTEAETRGVFGVPSWYVDDELYWGAERLARVEEHLARLAQHR